MDQPWLIVSTLGAVFFIFAYIRHKSAEKQDRLNRSELAEMEQTFDQFAKEIEEDNRKVLRHVSEYKEKHAQQTRMLKSRIDMLEKELQALKAREEESIPPLRTESVSVPKDEPAGQSAGTAADQPAAATPSAESASASQAEAPEGGGRISQRYKLVFDLYESGKSIDYIAKKTDMPKGEIQLILHLAQKQEEAYRVEG